MRNLLILMVAAIVLGLACAQPCAAQEYNPKLDRQQLKARQKQERKTLKMKEKYAKASWKDPSVDKIARLQMKHQMEQERRALLERQRNERQNLEDRQRLLKENAKLYGQ